MLATKMAQRLLEEIAKKALAEIVRLAKKHPDQALAILKGIAKFVSAFGDGAKKGPSREVLEAALQDLKSSIEDNDRRANEALRRRRGTPS